MEYDGVSGNYRNGGFSYPKAKVMETLRNMLTEQHIADFESKIRVCMDLIDDNFEIRDPKSYFVRHILVYLGCFRADELLVILMRFVEKSAKFVEDPVLLFNDIDRHHISLRLIYASNIEEEICKLLTLGLKIPPCFITIANARNHQNSKRIVDVMVMYQGYNPCIATLCDSELNRYAMTIYVQSITLFSLIYESHSGLHEKMSQNNISL